jgi:FkbH-like protein
MQHLAISGSRDSLPVEELSEIATRLIADRGLAAVPQAFAMVADAAERWASEPYLALFVQALGAAIEGFTQGKAAETAAALLECDAALAGHLGGLLHAAVFADGPFDAALMGDAILLCYVLIEAAAGRRDAALALLDSEKRSAAFHEAAELVSVAIAPFHAFKPKLIIWDLDDTLWRGTLAEGDVVELFQHRAEIVRTLNGHGVVSAICSKNDHDTAKAKLEELGLWDAFVFPRIAFVPKGEAVRQLIADMQLRPVNALFIDDNPHNLHEVAAAVPGIRVMDATEAACDTLLEGIVAKHRHIDKSRVEEYRVLQTKIDEREASSMSNEEFLRSSDIRILFTRITDNVPFAGRIEELINRSNQLNYTETRVEPGSMAEFIMQISENDTHAVFVWDKYGDYGLVGFVAVHPDTGVVSHFVLSCRVMHMGIEDAMIQRLREFYISNLRLDNFRKQLPRQRAVGITRESYLVPTIRERILEREAPRDPARIKLRLMCDCQSGAFHHYSRFRDEAEFDMNPRLFTLPMMMTGEHLPQFFPRYLVFAAATDYLRSRWVALDVAFTPENYAEAARRFCRFLAEGDHRMFLMLPPEDAPDRCYHPPMSPRRTFVRSDGIAWNALWRALAAEYPDHIQLEELTGNIPVEYMTDASHYRPPYLKELAGKIDDWYEAATAG